MNIGWFIHDCLPCLTHLHMSLFTWKRLRRFFTFFLLFLVVAAIALFTTVDRTPYKESAYYTQFRQEIQNVPTFHSEPTADTIQAGWAKENITPSYFTATAGYGERFGKTYTSVKDSIWVRAFVFDNGKQKVAILTADLLIIPPEVTIALAPKLRTIGFSLNQVYFCATHSHNSIGGWADKLVGKLIAGTYDPAIVALLVEKFTKAIQRAAQQKEIAAIGTAAYPAGELVENRFRESNPTDSLVRILKIRKKSGKTAILTVFSAHPTITPVEDVVLSRDYPGLFVDTLETDPRIEFAAFCAGAIGSHTWETNGTTPQDQMKNEASLLAQKITTGLDSIPVAYEKDIFSITMPLPLRTPHFRIATDWRVRPWVFYALYGDYPVVVRGLRLGNTTWLGMPCDFSGELTPAIQPYTEWNTHPLFITSFNGGYIGYITPDAYYDIPYYETREMNWFGPYNGAYLTEAATETLRRLSGHTQATRQ